MQKKYRRLRERAYAEWRDQFEELCARVGFTEFISLYIAEGYKRSRNTVSIANSDPAVIAFVDPWLRESTERKMDYQVQYHADQDLDAIQEFWSSLLGVMPDSIKLQRKSNSNQLASRTWRCEHGVLTARTNDTYFRARLQAWCDRLRDRWLDSI